METLADGECSVTGADYWQAKELQEQQQYLAAGMPLTAKEPSMKLNDMMPSKYLKTGDIEKDTLVTVKKLTKVNVARDDAEADYKWSIQFDEFEKPMVLNKTNLLRLGKALGDDTDDWIGKSVVLYVDDNVQYGAEVVSGLRIRAVKHPAAAAKRVARPEGGPDDDIPFLLNEAMFDVGGRFDRRIARARCETLQRMRRDETA